MRAGGSDGYATANNTVAIIVDGNMARSISEKYKIDPRKTASILDAFTCIFQGMIPYGAQFLLVASLTKGRVSPLDIIPLLWYLFLLGLFTVLSFLIPSYEKIDPLRRMGLGEPHRHPIVVEGDELEWEKIEIRSSCGPAWWASSPTFCWRALRLLWG